MASIISAGTTSGTALNMAGDTSGVLQLATNGSTTAVTIDTSQNVGIGTASPTTKLHVSSGAATITGASSTTARINMFNNAATTGGLLLGQGYASGTDNIGYMFNVANAAVVFGTNNTESIRIGSNGNVSIGTPNQISSAKVSISGGGGGGGLAPLAMVNPNQDTKTWNCGPDVNGNFVVTTVAGTNGQFISYGATSWTSTSDERLKTTLVPFENAVSKIVTLRAGTGRYLKDEESVSRSFLLAQDVQKVLPEAVNVQNDEIGTLGLQYTDLIPLLVAAIQEQQTIINDLKARITALEGAA